VKRPKESKKRFRPSVVEFEQVTPRPSNSRILISNEDKQEEPLCKNGRRSGRAVRLFIRADKRVRRTEKTDCAREHRDRKVSKPDFHSVVTAGRVDQVMRGTPLVWRFSIFV